MASLPKRAMSPWKATSLKVGDFAKEGDFAKHAEEGKLAMEFH
jgi:hypothetical protein